MTDSTVTVKGEAGEPAAAREAAPRKGAKLDLMFTAEERGRIRAEVLEFAAGDTRLSGGAVTGSAAEEREDRWSDIDLAFGVKEGALAGAVITDFTKLMYERYQAIHHHDVRAGAWIYRVFFLPGTLQVDLAFVEGSRFRPLGPTFRLVFGEAGGPEPFPPPASRELIGLAWLHALHARSCIERGKFWQAEYMISAVRDYVLTLACIRHDLPAAHGRGMDRLPEPVTEALRSSLIGRLDAGDLRRALAAVMGGLKAEIRQAGAGLDPRVEAEMDEIGGSWGEGDG